MNKNFQIDFPKVKAFCEKWKIKEFSFFGSVLTDDFDDKSDVDVIVAFDESSSWSLLDLVDMKEELELMFGRNVDLLTDRALRRSRNPYRKNEIISRSEVIYAA